MNNFNSPVRTICHHDFVKLVKKSYIGENEHSVFVNRINQEKANCIASNHDNKNTQKIHLTSNQDNRSTFVSHKIDMHIIRCVCGSEILVVPDLKAMDRAIKNHIAEHKQANDGPDRLACLEAFLTEQVLITAGKINLPK